MPDRGMRRWTVRPPVWTRWRVGDDPAHCPRSRSVASGLLARPTCIRELRKANPDDPSRRDGPRSHARRRIAGRRPRPARGLGGAGRRAGDRRPRRERLAVGYHPATGDGGARRARAPAGARRPPARGMMGGFVMAFPARTIERAPVTLAEQPARDSDGDIAWRDDLRSIGEVV